MTFDKYMRAVIDYYAIGGVTWEQSYVRVLKEERPDIYKFLNELEGFDLTNYDLRLGDFLYMVFIKWGR